MPDDNPENINPEDNEQGNQSESGTGSTPSTEGSGSDPTNSSSETESATPPTKEELYIAIRKKSSGIFTFRDYHKTTLVVNLTNAPLFVPYFGRRGVLLPVVTADNKDTVAMELSCRPVKSVRKRLWYKVQMLEDILNGKIAIGNADDIAEAIKDLPA